MFRRLAQLFKGFLGLFVGGLEKNHPEALLEVEKENLHRQIGQFNQGLATHAALVERLLGQVKKLDAEEGEWRDRTKALLLAGQRESAGEAALRYKEATARHQELRGQLDSAEVRYKELSQARDVAIKAARDKIESLRRNIDDMKVQRAMAELNEMAAGMVTNLGGSGDTMARLEALVEEERAKAAGRARAAGDQVDATGALRRESDQRALADLALADFAAAEGISLAASPDAAQAAPAATPAANSEKGAMGPVSQ